MHLNIEGICTKIINKLNNLEIFLKFWTKNVFEIYLNEHWLSPDSNNLLNSLNSFVLADYYARENICGGSCIFLRKGVNFKVRKDLSIIIDELVFEESFVEVVKCNALLVSIYRTPNYRNANLFVFKLESLLIV